MNDGRFLYLKSYGRIDTKDSMIKRANLHYRSRKYWHSGMNHGLAMAIVVAHDVYLECCEGELDPSWHTENVMDFHTFRDRLSQQGLTYRPSNQKYKGDKFMRSATAISSSSKRRKTTRSLTKKRGRSDTNSVGTGDAFCVQIGEVNEAKRNKRLMGDLGNLAEHLKSFAMPASKIFSGKKCGWCGQTAYTKCLICGVALHNFPAKGDNAGRACSIHYHDDMCFGLGFRDSKELDSKRGLKWKEPSGRALKKNRDHIQLIMK